MNFKKTLLVFSLIMCILFSVSIVVAGDVNDMVMASESQDSAVVSQATVDLDEIESDVLSSSNDDVLSESDNGTFTALQEKINNAGEGATIALENDYANDGALADGILISKSITINGNGYTIDAQHKSRIFNINASNVVLKDITFVNGNATLGGAIFCDGDNVTITGSTFINNTADYGGANYFEGTSKNILISGDFINNVAQKAGGANYFKGKVTNVTLIGNYNANIANSDCNGSDKSGSGGANCFNKTVDTLRLEGDYTGNIGYRGGANFIYGAASNVSIIGSYRSNTGILFGGANYFMNTLTDGTVDGKYSFNNATNWGGANYFNKFVKNVAISGNYVENSAAEGAALFFDRKMENVSMVVNLMDNKGNSVIYLGYRTDSTLTVKDMEFDYNATGSTEVSFTGAIGVNASVLNQPDAVVVVNNNTISVSGLDAGTYILSVSTVTDEEHDSVTEEVTITVNKIITQLSASAVTTTYNVNKDLVVTLKDANGNPLSGADVSVNLNGAKIYKTDEKGQIKVPTKGLNPKTYTAVITFNGATNYDKSTQSVKVTVKKATPKLTAKAKTFKKSVKTKKYSVTLKTNLNKALKNAKLTLKVNKKTFTARTNSKGVAVFKITNLAKKGKFSAVVKYGGNKYYNAKSANVKIVVK